MRDALPILYRLADANLEAVGVEIPSTAGDRVHELMVLAAPHLNWLYRVAEHLASTGRFVSTLRRTLSAPGLSGPPFVDHCVRIPLAPHGGRGLSVFATRFAEALKAQRAEVDLRVGTAAYRRAWFARWLAAAALGAHHAMTPAGCAVPVSMTPVLGEDAATAHAGLLATLAEFPGELIEALPIYANAERQAFRRYVDEIRMHLVVLAACDDAKRTRYEVGGRLADLLAYVTSLPLEAQAGSPRASKLHQRAARFLVSEGIAVDTESALARLAAIGIGDTFALRVAGAPRVRFPTKNSEHQAAFRGKAIYLGYWGRACADAGVLTPALIASRTRSAPQTRSLMALVPGSAPRADEANASLQNTERTTAVEAALGRRDTELPDHP